MDDPASLPPLDPDLANRFDYHQPSTENVAATHEAVRALVGQLAQGLREILPESRETSLALTNLEQAMFWANAAVARRQHEGCTVDPPSADELAHGED